MKTKSNFAEINNLTEFIDCITKNDLNNFISRGENKKYKNITSSAFRYQTPIKFQNMVSKFYDEIGNNITNMQKENFLAFSQHHGIPTNLVDFSTSPLVSLFFACYDIEKNNNNCGYVYFIDNKKLININEMMKDSNYNKNLLQKLINFESDILPLIIKLYEYEHTHIKDFENLVYEWINKLKNNSKVKDKYKDVFLLIDELTELNYEYTLCIFSKKILDVLFSENINDNAKTTDFILGEDYISDYNHLVKEIKNKTQYVYLDDILLVLTLIKTVFCELYYFCPPEQEKMHSFDLPFYFTYIPPNILPRVKNQSSLFIHQLYYDGEITDFYINKTDNRITQNILPDYTIRINNKKEILKSLDAMGINLKFIYNDYDNIAKYITKKHLDY